MQVTEAKINETIIRILIEILIRFRFEFFSKLPLIEFDVDSGMKN